MLTTKALSGSEIPKPLLTNEVKRKAMKNAILRFSKDKKKKKKKEEITESFAYVKFNYKAKDIHDSSPKVKVMDFNYKGRPEQKTYGQRDDILGWNINYFKNKRRAKSAIDDISSFAKMLSADKEEVYRRISYFFPEQAKYIRRYKRKHIDKMKHKKKWFWKKTDYSKLIDFNKKTF